MASVGGPQTTTSSSGWTASETDRSVLDTSAKNNSNRDTSSQRQGAGSLSSGSEPSSAEVETGFVEQCPQQLFLTAPKLSCGESISAVAELTGPATVHGHNCANTGRTAHHPASISVITARAALGIKAVSPGNRSESGPASHPWDARHAQIVFYDLAYASGKCQVNRFAALS